MLSTNLLWGSWWSLFPRDLCVKITWLRPPPWDGGTLNFPAVVLPCCHSTLLSCSLTPPNEVSWGSPGAFSPGMFFVADSVFSQSEMITAKTRVFISPVTLNTHFLYKRKTGFYPPKSLSTHILSLAGHNRAPFSFLILKPTSTSEVHPFLPPLRLQLITYKRFLSCYFQVFSTYSYSSAFTQARVPHPFTSSFLPTHLPHATSLPFRVKCLEEAVYTQLHSVIWFLPYPAPPTPTPSRSPTSQLLNLMDTFWTLSWPLCSSDTGDHTFLLETFSCSYISLISVALPSQFQMQSPPGSVQSPPEGSQVSFLCKLSTLRLQPTCTS